MQPTKPLKSPMFCSVLNEIICTDYWKLLLLRKIFFTSIYKSTALASSLRLLQQLQHYTIALQTRCQCKGHALASPNQALLHLRLKEQVENFVFMSKIILYWDKNLNIILLRVQPYDSIFLCTIDQQQHQLKKLLPQYVTNS